MVMPARKRLRGHQQRQQAQQRPEYEAAIDHAGVERVELVAVMIDEILEAAEHFEVAVNHAGDGEIAGEVLPGEKHKEHQDRPDEALGDLRDARGLRNEQHQQRHKDDDALAGDGDQGAELGDRHGEGVDVVPFLADAQVPAFIGDGEEAVGRRSGFGGRAGGGCGLVGAHPLAHVIDLGGFGLGAPGWGMPMKGWGVHQISEKPINWVATHTISMKASQLRADLSVRRATP